MLLYLLELILFDFDEDDEDDDDEPGEVNDDKDEEEDDLEEEFADSTPLFLSFLLILFKLKIGVTGENVD